MVTQDREALLAEGEQRDEQRAKMQVGEGLLRVGVTWDVIEAATEADQSRLPGAQGTTVRLWFLTHFARARIRADHSRRRFPHWQGKTCWRPYLTICIVTG